MSKNKVEDGQIFCGLLRVSERYLYEDFRSPDSYRLRNTYWENLFLEKQCVLRFSYWQI